MKKVVALILILLIMFSMFGCKSATEDDERAVIVVETEDAVDSSKEYAKVEKAPESVESVPPESEQQTEENTDEKPKPEQEAQPDSDTLTEQDVFSEYEVIVVMKKIKERKLSDFPEADAFALVQHYGYFTEDFYPEYKDSVVYGLLLNEPTKENVLETSKKLADNKHVAFSMPSYISFDREAFYVIVSGNEERIYTEADFEGMDIILDNGEEEYYAAVESFEPPKPGYCYDGYRRPPIMSYMGYEGNTVIRMKPKEETERAVYEQMKIAMGIKNVVKVIPICRVPKEISEIVAYVYPEYFPDEFTMEFFHYIEGEIVNVETYHDDEGYLNYNDGPILYKQIFIELENKDRKTMMKAVSGLAKDERVFDYGYFSNEQDYVMEYHETSEERIRVEYDYTK